MNCERLALWLRRAILTFEEPEPLVDDIGHAVAVTARPRRSQKNALIEPSRLPINESDPHHVANVEGVRFRVSGTAANCHASRL